MNFTISDELLDRVRSIIDWHRKEIKNPESPAQHIPEKDAWKKWDDNRLWCSFFFSITSPGGSKTAREYLKYIEDGRITFELHPEKLATLSDKERIKKIWEFGTKKNFLRKRLGRFFSERKNIGDIRNLEYKLANVFTELMKNGFIEWFETLDKLTCEREKARALEFLPGSNLKVSRDFLNNIGMTSTLIPLDVHILGEMTTKWNWNVPKATPSNRKKYEEIEDVVRIIAQKIKCTVVEIDKAIFSARTLGYHTSVNKDLQMPASPKVAPSISYGKSDPEQRYTKRPGTIWNEIYGGKTLQEIKAENPFASPDWLNNTAKFSSKRRSAVDELFIGRDEVDLSEIRRRSQNKGRYAAFRAIAHGIAKWNAHMKKLIKV